MATSNDKLMSFIANRFDEVEALIKNSDQNIAEFKDGVYNKMDSVYGEVLTVRQEQAAHQLDHDRINDRFEKIEAVPVVAHELKKLKN